jgi:hypothetical protein
LLLDSVSFSKPEIHDPRIEIKFQGIAGSSILTALTAWMCKPGYASLPVAYARAGGALLVRFSDLLDPAVPYVFGTNIQALYVSSAPLCSVQDLIQTRASLQLRVSSNELFTVLDEASENTFLCANTTANIQKFLFDGEADKVATELKNVVACASYMLEKKLVS